jgi:hypothetical protein
MHAGLLSTAAVKPVYRSLVSTRAHTGACLADEYTETRVQTLRKAIRAAGAEKDAALPVAYIENSSHCAKNDAGEKVIGVNKDRRWLPELMSQVPALLLPLRLTTGGCQS